MSRPKDDGRFLIQRHGVNALNVAKRDLETADERMEGDPTYKAHCGKVIAYIEGYFDRAAEE